MKKNRYQILAEVFGSVRQAGHTRAAAAGARAHGGVVLCLSHREAQEVIRTTNAEALGVDVAESLRGRRIPILLDNHLVQVMAEEIVLLQDRVERDACALEKMDRRLTEEVRISEALRRLVRTNQLIEEGAELNGALFALASIGTAVAFWARDGAARLRGLRMWRVACGEDRGTVRGRRARGRAPVNNGIRYQVVALDGSIVREGRTRTPCSRMLITDCDMAKWRDPPGRAREFIADMKSFDPIADDPLLIYREKKP